MKQKTKKKKGFTLIELLIVIAIIGILASIVLVNLSGARQDAKDVAYQAYAAQMAKLVEAGVVKRIWWSSSSGITTDCTSTTGNRCLGDYGGACMYNASNNPNVNAVVAKLAGSNPKGVTNPYDTVGTNRGTIIRICNDRVMYFVNVESNDSDKVAAFCPPPPVSYSLETDINSNGQYDAGDKVNYCYKSYYK